MNSKCFLVLLFNLLIPPLAFSQNGIAGTWNGIFIPSVFDMQQPSLVVEIYPSSDSIFTGITHLYYPRNQYEHYKMVGRYFKKDSILVFIESATIAVDLGGLYNCLGTYKTKLKREGNMLVQEGIWESNIRGCSPLTKVYLQKEIVEEKLPAPAIVKKTTTIKKSKPVEKSIAKIPSLKEKITTVPAITTIPGTKNIPSIKAQPVAMPLQLIQRETDVQSLLEIDAAEKDSIKVEVYDNGEIDGDSVSVYEEAVQRINKKLITTKPLTFYVSLNKASNPIAHLRLVAESLGSIPPCTALMIVTTKSKRYEVRLSSNFKKNATVELFLKE